MKTKFTLNDKPVEVESAGDSKLLWVLRDQLQLTGTKYSCGIALCGSCTVHMDGEPVRSCIIPVAAIAGKNITTIEGLSEDGSHPVQAAWIKEQVPQCGYCQSGQIMQAAALLNTNPTPNREEIVSYMEGVLCRCGAYNRIVKAVQTASKMLSNE